MSALLLDYPNFERPPFLPPEDMDEASYLHPSRSLGGISVGIYENQEAPLDVGEANETDSVYQVPVMLRAIPEHSIWRDGQHFRATPGAAGSIACFDMRHRWQTDLWFPFHSVHFYVPQLAFDELTDELRQPAVEILTLLSTEMTFDPVMHHLARALDAIVKPGLGVPSLLSDQLLGAVRMHLACRYGGLIAAEPIAYKLSGRQIARLKDRLEDHDVRDIRIAELAGICDMPVHRFGTAFRESFGMSPHQWRMTSQIKRAKTLLCATDLAIAEIAEICGFSDQSHLTRCFSKGTGMTPAAYRKAR